MNTTSTRTLKIINNCKIENKLRSCHVSTDILNDDTIGCQFEETDTDNIYISNIDDPTNSPRKEIKMLNNKTLPDYFRIRNIENPPVFDVASTSTKDLTCSSAREKSIVNNKSLPDNVIKNSSSFISTSSTTSLRSSSDVSSEPDSKFSNCPYLDGKFFKVTEYLKEGNKITSECQLCLPKKTYIKGVYYGVSTNFIKHLKSAHGSNMKDYEGYKQTKKQNKHQEQELQKRMKRKSEESENTDRPVDKKCKVQMKITDRRYKMNQETFDKRLLYFITDTMSAISILDKPSFISLFEGIDLKVMSRSTTTRKINDLCKQTFSNIQREIDKAAYVCTTADIWSTKRRSFLSLTCHWINDDYTRRSAALSCKRFYGSHTYDKIAESLEEIHSKFNINNEKLVATVTDNGSNFVKAFQEFSGFVPDTDNESDDEYELSFNSFVEFEKPCDECPGVENLNLPKHIRCASHTLNLVATTDVKNIIQKNTSLRTKHTACFSKCSTLSKMAGRPKSAEIIQEVLGHTLSYPGATRWNSLYDAISQIIMETDKMTTLFEKLGIAGQVFKESKLQYLTEYCIIIKPIANALDILQGESNIFYGYLIPCLGSIWTKLKEIEGDKLRFAKPILESCKRGLCDRFKSFFELTSPEASEAIVAAFTLPQFKLRWTSNFKNLCLNDVNDFITKMVIEVGYKYCQNNDVGSDGIVSKNSKNNENEFFELDEIENTQALYSNKSNRFKKTVELEILQYLHDPETNITTLNKYPVIKNLYFRFNMCLPSSASVERLFSFAQIINAPRRNALSDENFENLVLLKANNNYVN